MIVKGGKAETLKEAEEMLKEAISGGRALEKMAEFIEAQGGSREWVYDTSRFKKAKYKEEIFSVEEGYVSRIICDEIGMCSLMLGGGRETKESSIDLSVGLVLHKKTGDPVKKGESLATMYGNDKAKMLAAKERFLKAYSFSVHKVEKPLMIKGVVGA